MFKISYPKCMPWGYAAAVVATGISSDAAGDAADTQAQSARDANALSKAQYDQNRADAAPWREAGGQALNKLSDLLGLSSASSAPLSSENLVNYNNGNPAFNQRLYSESPAYRDAWDKVNQQYQQSMQPSQDYTTQMSNYLANGGLKPNGEPMEVPQAPASSGSFDFQGQLKSLLGDSLSQQDQQNIQNQPANDSSFGSLAKNLGEDPRFASLTQSNPQLFQSLADKPQFNSLQSILSQNPELAKKVTDSEVPGFGNLTRSYTLQDFQNDPVAQLGLQFGLDQGKKAIERRAAGSGGYDSGATLKALTKFGNDYGNTKAGDSYSRFMQNRQGLYDMIAGDTANQFGRLNTDYQNQLANQNQQFNMKSSDRSSLYNMLSGDQNNVFNRLNTGDTNVFNRLSSIAGLGQQANSQIGSQGLQVAGQMGDNTIGAANARGASTIAQGNAWSSGLNTLGNYYNQNKMMNQLQGSQTNPYDSSAAYKWGNSYSGFNDPSNYG